MEEVLFALWVAAILGPLAWSWYHKASIAMAMTLSLLFGYIVQLMWGWTLENDQLSELEALASSLSSTESAETD